MNQQAAEWRRLADQAELTDIDGGLAVRLRTVSGIWKPSGVQLAEVGGETALTFEVPPKRPNHTTQISDWGWTKVTQTDGMLDAFTRLTSPDSCLSFAREWGPLFACGAAHPGWSRRYHLLTRDDL